MFLEPFWSDANKTQEDRGVSILVTGGTGVLGWRVVWHAKERWPNANIVVFDLNKVSPQRKVKNVSVSMGMSGTKWTSSVRLRRRRERR